jgi:putative colanic acid biosysnthesis UDP-glucose lipid carrier transferase
MISEASFIPPPKKASVPNKRTKLRACIDDKASFFFCKRLADVVGSFLFIIIILSWLFPLIALLIWLDSGGPILFLQERVGRGGRTFICFKFRTMQPGPDGEPRITAFGQFLRKSNIDEFPQFMNVLLGSMSLVGPRPHMHSDCRRFSRLVTRYKLRNFVKPGITGLAQVKGYHGPAIGEESIVRRYEWDAFYVRNASFWLDIKILRRTIFQSASNLLGLARQEPNSPAPSSVS